MTCEGCGREVRIGEWPFCPHGFPLAGLSIVDDTVEWRRCETLGHDDYWYNSKSALAAEAKRRGLENVVRHDDHYYATQRKQHDEMLRDTGQKR